jgi:hemerythrin
MDKIFRWKPTDAVNVALLDRQHQALFETAQELYDALSRGDGMAVAEDIFAKLMDYSSNHFAAEEALMEKHRFPGIRAHQEDHRAFITQLMIFKDAFNEGSGSALANMLPYLQYWIKHHVQGADRQYSEFLKKQRIGPQDNSA